ncbi:histone H2B [Beta vulgaris subsp. vulgaris]|uniref:histone H2B n=1 Tax=Beta vulgaris subsp. vulgaris TaxID=3555 RepID=UPI00203680BF|nr:histone H2B [Beta vulgaris subsp. vulgaris]
MAPKRGRKVVKTTKVVKETVEVVSILGSQSQEDQAQTQAQPEVTERREEQTSVMTKSIPIEDIEEAQDDQETETQEPDFPLEWPKVDKISTPPREESPPRQEEDEAQDQDQAQPKNEAQEGKKATMAKTKTGRKRGRRMRGGMRMGEGGGEGYKRYIFRVLKQVHPGMAITSGTMTVINNFMTDMFERLAAEASKLSMYSKKQTMSAREIQGAVKLVLPGELGKHAVAEGSKAVSNYVTYDSKK